MKIFSLEQISKVINLQADLDHMIELHKSGFIDFSKGLYDVPSPMQFIFGKYGGDSHIKGASKVNGDKFVLKIANGSQFGGEGIVLIFSTKTGKLEAILQDKGYLTTLRTAIAGYIASTIVPWRMHNIGIIGSGDLAKLLHKVLTLKYPNSELTMYARNQHKLAGITNNICNSPEELVSKCDLIFTATSANSPVLHDIRLNTRKAIISLGSDDEHKQELSKNIFTASDRIVVDSKSQAIKYGDTAKQIKAGVIVPEQIQELGEILKHGVILHANLIIVDLTGIAVQDLIMAEFVLGKLGL